jgi:polyisoprenoid-binding protein YceI
MMIGLNIMLKRCALAGAMAASAACATAARIVYPVNEDALKARAGDYVIDPAHTSVIFSVDHFGFSTYYGRFNDVSGRLSLNVDDPSRSETAVKIKAASVDTPSDDLDDKLRGAEMFDAAAFPDIVFESRSVTPTGAQTATIDALLTIKGVTQPVTLAAEFHGSGASPLTRDRRVGFDATAALSRSAFGLDAWNGFVGDKVTLIIAVEFKSP